MAEPALSEGLWNQTCFHLHQSAEKALKALVSERGDDIPRTHRLADLMSLLGGKIREELEDDPLSLEGFYVPTRYPDAMLGSLPEGLPEEEDAAEALTAARRVARVACEIIGSPFT